MRHPWRAFFTHSTIALAQPTYLAVRYLIDHQYFRRVHPAWFAVTAVSWYWIITRITIPFFTNPLRYVPSPPGENFPLCHLDTNGGRPPTDIITNLFKNTPNDGLIVAWLPFYLWAQVMPTRPDTLMDLLNTHNYDWEKPAEMNKFIGRTIGEGLIVAEGDKHKAMRKAVAPAFSGRHIRDLVPLFYTKGSDFADSLARQTKQSADGSVEIMGQMSHVTLDIIGAAGVGKDFKTIENDQDPLAKLYATLTDENRGPVLLFYFITAWMPAWFIRRLRGTVYARFDEARIRLREDARALMREKKQMMLDKPEQQKDIIATIMRSGDFSDDYLVDQLLTFLAAGHDTTASALTWTIWLLCMHPEIQERLRAECNAHLADKPASEVDATTFDSETMPYLTAVCNETLRHHPSVTATVRNSVRPTMIGPYHIPAGTPALIAPWAINRDPALWGDDAHEYNPDRWLNGPNAANGGAQSPLHLMTFIHGPRSCIGREFARLEMKCLLATLIKRFRFEVADPDAKVEIGGSLTIKPHGGLRLRLHDLKAEVDSKTDATA
ncbi:cytochrome P450 [Exophiala viscosa]|uniref:cytochrome P450 n=1 Tax=Exophiala viscosa TaxID=2486360 RepID=UPI00218FBCE3|nr:cytochrome P450 [Exophiala viscosa]